MRRARVPCWASVAWPEKPIGSPTFQRVAVLGVSIVTAGGVLPALITTVSVSLRPPWSRTVSCAVKFPAEL